MSVLKTVCFCVFLCFESSGFIVKNTENDLFRLDIVHYNDFHARFEETSVDYPVCQTNDNKCLGGFSRLFHEITELMMEKPGSILLNAGDSFQGTYWYTLMKWNVTQTFVNMLPNDVHAIGNHEFDDGISGMVPYLASLKAPVVAANIDVSAEPSLQGLIKPSTVLERRGRKIGVIGLITQETAILIVTASAFSKYVGNLTTFFDFRGELQSFHGTPVFLNRSIPEDPQITSLMKPYADKLNEMVKMEIAYSNDALVAKPCGGQECAIGNLIADSLVDFTKQKYESNHTNIAIVLRNSIRGSIAQGVINRGAVINVLPFGNSVVTFRLLGEHIVKALGNCVLKSWVKKPFESPHTPHVSGLRITLNVTEATATSVLVRTDNKEIKKDKKKSKNNKSRRKRDDHYQPIALDEEYQVTTFDFITFGGSQFDVLKDNAKDLTVIGIDEFAVEDYMKKVTPISAVLDHRLTIVE